MLKIKERLKLNSWSKKKTILIIVILMLLIIALVFIYNNNKQAKASASNFLTVPVQRGTIEYSIDGSGTLQPSERYALKTWAGGTVTEVLVTAGTQVKKGQPLLRVQNDELESQARQAVLEWEIAKSDLAEMTSPLPDTDYNRRAAELKVEQYRIALEDKKEQQEKLVLKAPFTGTILESKLQVGQRVNSGVVAVTFATTDEMEVVASFSDRDINALSVGMEVQVFVKGLNKDYKGKIKEKAFQAKDATSGMFEVLISIDKPDDALRPGMQTYNNIIIKDIENDTFVMHIGGPGYIRYTQSEEMVTEVSGTVAEIYQKPGDKVYKGQPLMRLVNDEIDRQVKDAENQLANAEEQLRQLLNPDEKTIKQQQLKVEQNYQKVLSTNKKLDSLNVVSPIDGVVVSIAVKPGDELGADTSSAGQELLVVCNFEKNYLEIPVDELDINKIKFGQQASIKIDALPNVVAKGQVIGIAQEGKTSDGVTKYPVTLEVGYVEGIKGGMTATATILLEKKENVLRVPAEAVTTSNGRSTVQVVENGQPRTKQVKTGINSGRWVEILEGLSEGEQVIIARTSTTSQTQQFGPPPGMGVPGGMGGPGQQRNTNTRR